MRHSPVDAQHRALGARMVPFGGWEMPLQYTGVLEEHRACREHGVLFDVSHLGTIECGGPGAFALLQWLLTNDLDKISPGRAQYTHLLDPDDAHVVDDIIVWWLDADQLLVMPNASNTDRILGALHEAATEHAHADCEVEDVTAARAVLAIQGPHARERLRGVLAEAASVGRFAVRPVHDDLFSGWSAGTGYTGEDGLELHVPAASAVATWRAALSTGLTPAGLGARDTLRLEAGLPLHGHELGPGITPLQAGLGWVVRFDKGDFRGRDALLAERDAGPRRRLRGLRVEGRQIPRTGCTVAIDDETVGEVTSGNFSPVLECGIALAFLPPDVAEGAGVIIDIRGRAVPAMVVPTPFVATGSAS